MVPARDTRSCSDFDRERKKDDLDREAPGDSDRECVREN